MTFQTLKITFSSVCLLFNMMTLCHQYVFSSFDVTCTCSMVTHAVCACAQHFSAGLMLVWCGALEMSALTSILPLLPVVREVMDGTMYIHPLSLAILWCLLWSLLVSAARFHHVCVVSKARTWFLSLANYQSNLVRCIHEWILQWSGNIGMLEPMG